MCGSVQPQRQQPVYTPPAACPPPPQQQAPKACAPPPCDTFTPPPVVSPEKAPPPVVASPERPTIQSTPNADAPAACAKNDACAPCAQERKGLMKMLGALFTAVFAFAAIFMSRRAETPTSDARPERDRGDRDACARDWRNFEGRPRERVLSPERAERDARTQAFTPPAYTQRV